MEQRYIDKLVKCKTEYELQETINSFSKDSGMWFIDKLSDTLVDVVHHIFTDSGVAEEVLHVELDLVDTAEPDDELDFIPETKAKKKCFDDDLI